jgi:hypothetical protein
VGVAVAGRATEVAIRSDIAVPTRDGEQLATDVYLPVGIGAVPAIVQRHPYDKGLAPVRDTVVDVLSLVRSGYAVVVQDTRGRFASSGTFTPFRDEGTDGADTIEWVAAQDWCNGTVGMCGASYFGATQWQAALERPAALKAIAPSITGADFYDGWTYQGGAFRLGSALYWTLSALALGDVVRSRRQGEGEHSVADAIEAVDAFEQFARVRPLTAAGPAHGLPGYYGDWLAHPSYDDYWRAVAIRERYADVRVPSLSVAGWFDLFLDGTLDNYVAMREQASEDPSRAPRLTIGPWSHTNMTGAFNCRNFGFRAGAAVTNLTAIHRRFFDRHLKGRETADEPPVLLFVMGDDTWRSELDWPLPDTRFAEVYLDSGGSAATIGGDGRLTSRLPLEQASDAYSYDPENPVPTIGGGTYLPGLEVGADAGPTDQREVEHRADVLCYTSAPLDGRLEITGTVELVLFVSSSAPDTDFTAKLVDAQPDGRALLITDGILRARYRESLSEPRLMTPDEVYELRIRVGATSIALQPGHRLRLEVSSSNFPRFDRNTNTGAVIAEAQPGEVVTAVNRVLHGPRHPSRLVLPLIERDSKGAGGQIR